MTAFVTIIGQMKMLAKGGSLCDHYNKRTLCKQCKKLGIGGGSLCDHDSNRSFCKKMQKVGYWWW